MPKGTRKHPNEKNEAIIRRWKRAVEKDGVLQAYREKEFYEKPSLKRKRAKAAAKKRHQRALAEEREFFRKQSLNR